MKLRINGNSVRLRLSKSEVDEFGEKGYMEARTGFGDVTLTYALSVTDHCDMRAEFADGKITMYLPDTKAKEWVETPKVGFDANMDLGDGNELYLLLEKDFKCLDNTIEDQSDNYENPLAAQFKK
ncbi:MAG: hypothetical protein KDC07_08665 [Chitinophagaceae bacterium]|nr:hypothetical protein [Chitinophagaceae bacterium]MCB9046265.1 hypothetical protein [Chitinophagales bacterium]